MGTSSSFGGPGGNTPLVPSWLGGGGDATPPDGADPGSVPPGGAPPAPPARPAPKPPGDPIRFKEPRTNFSKFASSGGADRASLGRAIAGYVSKSSGSAGLAAQRMGASRTAAANLLGFLSNAQVSGLQTALRTLNLDHLAGRPIEEVFLGLAAAICPESGTVDDGIARDAFMETIAEVAGLGITDLDALTTDQIQTVLETYATHTIKARLCNDIGANAVFFPRSAQEAQQVQDQLTDFIRRGVGDALTQARDTLRALTPDLVKGFVDAAYESAFDILQTLGEAEAEAE